MSYKIVQQVSPNVTYTIPLTQGILGDVVEVWNSTPFDLDYYGFGSSSTMVIVAGTGHQFHSSEGNMGKLIITPVNNNNVSGTGVINIVVYNQGDIVPKGRIFPVSIPTQVVQATVTSASTLSNENSTLGQKIIDIGVAGNTDMLDIFNDHFLWQVIQSGVAHQVLKGQTSGNPLQIGQSGDIAEFLGQVLMDGGLNIVGRTASVSGSVSGTATLYQLLTGTAKLVYINLANYSDAGTKTLALPVAFTAIALIICHIVNQLQCTSSGTAQTQNILTSLAAGGGGINNTSTTLRDNSISWVKTAFDTVSLIGDSTARTSFIIIAGV